MPISHPSEIRTQHRTGHIRNTPLLLGYALAHELQLQNRENFSASLHTSLQQIHRRELFIDQQPPNLLLCKMEVGHLNTARRETQISREISPARDQISILGTCQAFHSANLFLKTGPY